MVAGGCWTGYAGSFNANFDNGQLPAGTVLNNHNDPVTYPGEGVITTTGGVNNSGVLKITSAFNSESGSFIISDLDPGVTDGVNSIDVKFKLRMGGGTASPADGISFCMAPGLSGMWGEEGTGNGLTLAIDTWNNETSPGVFEGAPSIDVKWAGAVISGNPKPISFIRTGNNFVDVELHLSATGYLDLTYNGTKICDKLFIPSFQPIVGASYGFAGRTGGANENQWVDDLSITTTTGPRQLSFTSPPKDLRGLAGKMVTFYSTVTWPADVASYQWFILRPGEADFVQVDVGGDQANYTTEELYLDMEGTQYKLVVTDTLGGTLESDPVTLHVEEFIAPEPPTASFTFDDGVLPGDTAVYGTAQVAASGGLYGLGMLKITEAANDQNGSFIINDFNNGVAQDSLVATFSLQLGPGTDRPADGFSFNWASDLPSGTFNNGAEEGAGTGLTITFDTWDNLGFWDNRAEAPSVDVKWNGQIVASRRLPIQQLITSKFVDVLVRVSPSGLVDVAYDGQFLHWQVPLANYTAVANGRFAFAARTGGANEAVYVDDINLTTTEFIGPIVITKQPVGGYILVGHTASFTTEVNDPARATFQWQKKAPGAADFVDIDGAIEANYTTPELAAADSLTQFRVLVTSPQNVATSDAATITILDLVRPTANLDIDFNFDDGQTPADTALFNNAISGAGVITTTGGINDSGVLHLTDAVNGASGAFLINKQIQGGRAVDRFVAAMDLKLESAGVPADGMSFNWGIDLIQGTAGEGEKGSGTGLSICFDTYDNVDGNPDNGVGEAPAFNIKWKGVQLTNYFVPKAMLMTPGGFSALVVGLNANGTLDMAFQGKVIFYHFPLPNFSGMAGGKFGFYARTGGANENAWVDNLAIQAFPSAVPPTITKQPINQMVLADGSVTMHVRVSDPPLCSFQWQQKAPGAAAWTDIAGATAPDYATPALAAADNGTQYRVQIAVSVPVTTLTSEIATVTVIETQPTVSFNFDDGILPEGTALGNNATISTEGGVDGGGVIKLTIAQNDQNGRFIVNDPANGEKVVAMTVSFNLLIGGGTALPADGMGFAWASDIPDPSVYWAEDGVGSGLTVGFDTWDNSVAPNPAEAPAIDAIFANEVIGHTMSTIAEIAPNQFVPVIIRVNANATLDVSYNGNLIYQCLPLPGFTGFRNAKFGFGAHTGGANANHWVDDLQISVTTAPDLAISIAREGDNVVITYQGVLQAADAVTGEYVDVPDAVSPYTVAPEGAKMFFRTRAE